MNYGIASQSSGSSKNSGDFIFTHESERGNLVCFGDIAGNSEPSFVNLKNEIKLIIDSHHDDEEISEVIKKIYDIPKVSETGLALFVGYIRKDLPLLQYAMFGDIKAYLASKHENKTLKTQAQMVAKTLLSNFHEHAIKFEKNQLILCSDGISSNKLAKLKNFYFTNDPQKTAHQISEHCSKEHQDALAVSICLDSPIHYHKSKGKHQKSLPETNIEKTHVSTRIDNLQSSKSTSLKKALTPKVLAPVSAPFQPKQIALDVNWLFNISELPKLNKTINELFNNVGINDAIRIKISIICNEILEQQHGDIQLGLSHNFLVLKLAIDNKLLSKIRHLFSYGTHFVLPDGSQCIGLHIESIPFSDDELFTFRERAIKGLDKEKYLAQRQQQKTEHLISEKTKLQSMGEMIGSISHQWRQPLNELALKIQILQSQQMMESVDDKTMDTFVDESIDLIRHMSQTIDDFRNYLKPDSAIVDIDASTVIKQTLSLQQAQLTMNHIDIKIIGDSFTFKANSSEFKHVLMILINNAKDALVEREGERKITFTLAPKSIEIKDNGGGVPENMINKISQPYVTTKDKNGTGLGLYIAKSIIEGKLNGVLNFSNHADDGLPGFKIKIQL